jgi:tripartite ATP-independent transporter DctM subunit
MLKGQRAKVPRHAFVLKEALLATWESKWELAIPTLVVVSMLGALATPVEAAGLSLIASVLVETVVFRDLHPIRVLPKVLARAGTLVGAVLILLGVAMGLTSYLVDAEVPRAVVNWTTQHIRSPWLFLLVLNGVLLMVGSVVEIYAAIVVLAPLISPMAAAYQIDPLHLGIVFLANLELGFLLPPMGLNLILASSRFSEPLVRLYRVIVPFLLILAAGLLVVTYVNASTVGVVEALRLRHHEKATDGKHKPPDTENFDWDAQ